MSSPEMTPPAGYPPPPPPATVVTPAPAMRLEKSPWVALLLSLLMPGLGQVYNGQFAKALSFFAAFAGSIYLIADGHPLPFALFMPFIVFWNMIDAYRGAEVVNARGLRATPIEEEPESPAWGIALAVMGALLLLNNLGWLRLGALVPYWPVLLIAAGVVLLRRSMKPKGTSGTSV